MSRDDESSNQRVDEGLVRKKSMDFYERDGCGSNVHIFCRAFNEHEFRLDDYNRRFHYRRSAMSFFVILYSFVLITGAISGEFASGTIKQLLIRPVSRHRILLSKWVASLLLSIGLYALMMLVIFLFGLFFPHQQSLVDTLIDAGLFVLYATPTFVFYVSFATLVAVITRNTAVTVVITILPYFFADIFLMIANQYEWTQWVVFRHIDVFTNYHPASFFEPPFESMWLRLAFSDCTSPSS